MPRYIDAEKLEKDGWWAARTYRQDATTTVYETKKMTDFPTADAVERKVGEWEQKEDPYGFFDTIPVCSICGCTTKMRETYHYCPNCGAEMVDKDINVRSKGEDDAEIGLDKPDKPKQISAEFAKLMTEGEIQVRWRKRETD